MARYELALLVFERGEHAPAMQELDRFIDVYNARRASLTGEELRAIALACRMLGRTDPQLFKDALRAFDESIARDTMELEGRVQLAEMFLEKFNSTDARTSLDEVLRVNPKHPRGLLAMARVNAFEGNGKSTELVAQSLEVNPSDPEARALAAMHLIDVEQYDEAC
jgi:cytochrome c-type biogenesis protein CcmH/NrfG